MNRLHTIFHWLLFKIWYFLPLTRPARLVLGKGVRFDWFSFIVLDRQSTVRIGNNARIKRSVMRLRQSSWESGDATVLSNARIIMYRSQSHTGIGLIVEDTMFSLMNDTTLHAGDHLMFRKVQPFRCGLFTDQAKIEWGTNVNLSCHLICDHGYLQIGDHVFINEGTQLRCTEKIEFGSYILVSYECIIFDTNTHSLHAEDRQGEIKAGFPNNTLQSADIKSRVKRAPIRIGDNAWIGTRAIILKGSTLGNGSIVGAASVLSGLTVPDGKIASGNPGRIHEA